MAIRATRRRSRNPTSRIVRGPSASALVIVFDGAWKVCRDLWNSQNASVAVKRVARACARGLDGSPTREPYSHVHVLYVAQASGRHVISRARASATPTTPSERGQGKSRRERHRRNESYTPAEDVEETRRRHPAPVEPDYV